MGWEHVQWDVSEPQSPALGSSASGSLEEELSVSAAVRGECGHLGPG